MREKFSVTFDHISEKVSSFREWLEKKIPDSNQRNLIEKQLTRLSPPVGSELLSVCACDGLKRLLRATVFHPTSSSAVLVFEDVSEQMMLETQLCQAQKMDAIATHAGRIVHDFNNILGVIMGLAELSLGDLQSTNATLEHLQGIIQAAERARLLVRRILSLSRHSEGKRDTLDLRLVVRETLALLRPIIPSSVRILETCEAVGPIRADATQMHQILMNLCVNALHAMRTNGGILEICLKNVVFSPEMVTAVPDMKSISYVVMSVSDTGCGMSPDVIVRIFDPYFTTKEREGTGLGLSIVLEIVKNHDGFIEVKSVPDEGTTFHIYLPDTATEEHETGHPYSKK